MTADLHDSMIERIDELEAEVARLRAALKRLDDPWKYSTEVCKIARNALNSGAPS